MKKVITMLIRNWIKSPVKISMTIISVALGTGILILSFSAGTIINSEVAALMSEEGTIFHVANGDWGDDGRIEQERPAQWDRTISESLISDSSYIESAAIVNNIPVPNINANGKSYQVRSVIGSDESYFDVFSLEIIYGVPMTEEDFSKGLTKVWLSLESAELLFGSGEEAIGKLLSPPGRKNRDGSAPQITQFKVAGVFENPTEVSRKAYGIADIIMPTTSFMPTDRKSANMIDWLSGMVAFKSSESSINKVTAEINQIVEANYGDDISVTTWEGTTRGESSYMEELRRSISIFSISLRILGIVLLLTSSVGIFSIMVVEALGRRREIAIERALGASRYQIVKEFWQWSLILSLFGAIVGIGLAVLLSGKVLGSISPLLSELTSTTLSSSVKPLATIQGVLLTIGLGGVLGLLPSFNALKGDISDILREA